MTPSKVIIIIASIASLSDGLNNMNDMIFFEQLIVSPEMIQLIAEIDQFKGSWQAFKQMAPEQLKALRHIATIESVGSSTRIEGSKLSDSEVEKLLAGLNTHSFRSRDEEEVAGYAHTIETVFANYEYIPLSENYIKQLHAMLLQYSSKDVRHRGEYKKFPNHVEAFDADGKSLGIIFETTPPFETMEEMRKLVSWTQEALEEKRHHPLLIIGTFIVLFLAIHPFQDGNGRLSRILTTLLLLKTGYTYVPYSSLEAVIEDNKQGYYVALRRTQATLKKENPDLLPWLSYFLRILQKQKQRLEVKLEQDKSMYLSLPKLSALILQYMNQHARATISDLSTAIDAPRNTLKKYVATLVEQGYLKQHGQGKGTWYTLK